MKKSGFKILILLFITLGIKIHHPNPYLSTQGLPVASPDRFYRILDNINLSPFGRLIHSKVDSLHNPERKYPL